MQEQSYICHGWVSGSDDHLDMLRDGTDVCLISFHANFTSATLRTTVPSALHLQRCMAHCLEPSGTSEMHSWWDRKSSVEAKWTRMSLLMMRWWSMPSVATTAPRKAGRSLNARGLIFSQLFEW